MVAMLCRNRVADFAKWKAVFASHAPAHRKVGLRLMNLWRGLEDFNNVFFLFEVTSLDKARAFISNPAAAEAGKASGVLNVFAFFLASGFVAIWPV